MKNKEIEALKQYMNTSLEEIEKFMNQMDMESLHKAKEMIIEVERNHNRVHITGIGKPGHVAGYIASLLSSTGTPTYELNGTEAIHGSAGQVQPGDVVIAISNSGETQELKKTVETLRNNEASIISVTGNAKSWLASHGDVTLYAGVEQEGDTLNKPPRSSIIAEIVVLQCLSVLLQYEKNIDSKQYVKWHPGGILGKSIKDTL